MELNLWNGVDLLRTDGNYNHLDKTFSSDSMSPSKQKCRRTKNDVAAHQIKQLLLLALLLIKVLFLVFAK